MQRNDKTLIEKGESLLYCLKNESPEDAYEWCFAIMQQLYHEEIKKRVRLETAISALKIT